LPGIRQEFVEHIARRSNTFFANVRIDRPRYIRHWAKCAAKDCERGQAATEAREQKRCGIASPLRNGAARGGRPPGALLAPAASPVPERPEKLASRGHALRHMPFEHQVFTALWLICACRGAGHSGGNGKNNGSECAHDLSPD
jgi:hypothetical protein